MKLRPLLVLLLFLVSAGILVWIYYGTTRAQAKPPAASVAEILGDLHACGSRKHVKAAQYDHFAGIAREEDDAQAASLFRAIAASERLNEQNCANALIRLGGHYNPPMKVVVFNGRTADNLNRSITNEQQSLAQLQGEDIRRAMDRGNRYAARVLIWAVAGDRRHLVLMKACRDHAPQSGRPVQTRTPAMQRLNKNVAAAPNVPIRDDTRSGFEGVAEPTIIPGFAEMRTSQDASNARYMVCPVCGNIYSTGEQDVYCPFCLTDSRLFMIFE